MNPKVTVILNISIQQIEKLFEIVGMVEVNIVAVATTYLLRRIIIMVMCWFKITS